MVVSNKHYKKLLKLNYNGKTEKHKSLKNLTTFKLGGECDIYLEIHTLENFIKSIMYIEGQKLKYFIIGNGSKLLVSDKGYNGIVIKLLGDFARIDSDNDQVECGAGLGVLGAYKFSKELGLSGFENLAGIPGSIGGLVYMNAGALGFEISQIVLYVVAYVNGKITYFSNDDCEFGYRTSIFQKNKAIILRVGFQLNKCEKSNMENKYLEILKLRKTKQPIILPNAGSVFKRLEGIEVSKMLDEDGFKGRKFGGAIVSSKHSNFIVNQSATASDVFNLIRIIKDEFYSLHKIELIPEIIYLGDFDETNK